MEILFSVCIFNLVSENLVILQTPQLHQKESLPLTWNALPPGYFYLQLLTHPRNEMWITVFSSSAHVYIYECYCFHGTLLKKQFIPWQQQKKVGNGKDLQWKLVHAPPLPQWLTPCIQYISVQNMSAFTSKKKSLHEKGQAGNRASWQFGCLY